MKILVIRFSSIGDIVLTTPVIRCLKKQIHDVELHTLVKKKFASLYKTNPYVDKVFEYDSSLKDVVNELKQECYDVIIDLQKNKRSLRVTHSLKRPHYSFPKLNLRKLLLTTFKINVMPDIHIVDRYFKAVEKLNVINDYQGLDFFISDENNYPISTLPDNFQDGYYAFVIGGTYKTKILPAEKIVEIIRRINKPVVLLGGPDDVERAEEILSSVIGQQSANSYCSQHHNPSSQVQKDSQILNLVGKINLEQSASLVKNADSVLTNDTGLMHIAAAFHKNIVSVWGNTVPELGMYPYLPEEPEKCHIVECKNVRCRPCSKLGFKECPKSHFRCMMEIDIDSIINNLI